MQPGHRWSTRPRTAGQPTPQWRGGGRGIWARGVGWGWGWGGGGVGVGWGAHISKPSTVHSRERVRKRQVPSAHIQAAQGMALPPSLPRAARAPVCVLGLLPRQTRGASRLAGRRRRGTSGGRSVLDGDLEVELASGEQRTRKQGGGGGVGGRAPGQRKPKPRSWQQRVARVHSNAGQLETR
jgi:hypothetical protein